MILILTYPSPVGPCVRGGDLHVLKLPYLRENIIFPLTLMQELESHILVLISELLLPN